MSQEEPLGEILIKLSALKEKFNHDTIIHSLNEVLLSLNQISDNIIQLDIGLMDFGLEAFGGFIGGAVAALFIRGLEYIKDKKNEKKHLMHTALQYVATGQLLLELTNKFIPNLEHYSPYIKATLTNNTEGLTQGTLQEVDKQYGLLFKILPELSFPKEFKLENISFVALKEPDCLLMCNDINRIIEINSVIKDRNICISQIKQSPTFNILHIFSLPLGDIMIKLHELSAFLHNSLFRTELALKALDKYLKDYYKCHDLEPLLIKLPLKTAYEEIVKNNPRLQEDYSFAKAGQSLEEYMKEVRNEFSKKKK